jgi:hypothetical protein
MKQLELFPDLTTWTPEEEEAMQQMLAQNTNGISADDIQAGGSHYKDMSVQPWTVMEALLTRDEFIGYLKGNLIKYGMRQGKKDSPDAEKWHHYNMKLNEIRAKNV